MANIAPLGIASEAVAIRCHPPRRPAGKILWAALVNRRLHLA
jgi:hypothetical protein